MESSSTPSTLGVTRSPWFCEQLRTIGGSNQPNTYLQVRSFYAEFRSSLKIGTELLRRFSKRSFLDEIRDRRDDTMATILNEEILVRSQAVVARVVEGETLIFPVRDRVGGVASIYSAASLIWKLLASPRTLTQLAVAFAQEFDVEQEMVRGDVADFLNEMMAVGMVELSASVMMAEAEGPWSSATADGKDLEAQLRKNSVVDDPHVFV